jgi:hypothetical protein
MSDSSSIWDRLRGLLSSTKSQPSSLANELAPPPAADAGQTPLVDLVLGIDLGTSCTKVVIGDPSWKDRSFVVPFGASRESLSAWLHPTRFGAEVNLKMRLMDDPASEKVRDALAGYLAEVIDIACTWFGNESPADYRRRRIRWSLNLGFPGKTVDETTPLATAYREVAKLAVSRSSQPDIVRVQLYPEIAAQLAGYVNSPFRQPGNLVLIDVGAGTLDVSTIILHGSNEQDVVSFHVCKVAPFGVLQLYRNRSSALAKLQAGCVQHQLEHFQGGDKPAPENFEEMVSPQWKDSLPLKETFRELSVDFEQQVVHACYSCLAQFRKLQRDAHSDPSFDPWGNRLRFFITGGGSRSRFYRRLLAEGRLEKSLIPYTRWLTDDSRRRGARQGLRLEKMPNPKNLEGFPSALAENFDRLSVAYGLAYGSDNLMKVTACTCE